MDTKTSATTLKPVFLYFAFTYLFSFLLSLPLYTIPFFTQFPAIDYVSQNLALLIPPVMLIVILEIYLSKKYYRNVTRSVSPLTFGLIWLAGFMICDFLLIVMIFQMGFGVYQYLDIWLVYTLIYIIPTLMAKNIQGFSNASS